MRGYRSQLPAWVNWCVEHGVDARAATINDVKCYREDLVAQGRQPTTIAHKLNVLRRVYAAAVAAGLRAVNPAIGIRAPRDRRARGTDVDRGICRLVSKPTTRRGAAGRRRWRG